MKKFYNILFVALLAVTAGCQKKETAMPKKSHSKKTEMSHQKSAAKKKPCAKKSMSKKSAPKKSMKKQDSVMIQRLPMPEIKSGGMGERSIESYGVEIQRAGGGNKAGRDIRNLNEKINKKINEKGR